MSFFQWKNMLRGHGNDEKAKRVIHVEFDLDTHALVYSMRREIVANATKEITDALVKEVLEKEKPVLMEKLHRAYLFSVIEKELVMFITGKIKEMFREGGELHD